MKSVEIKGVELESFKKDVENDPSVRVFMEYMVRTGKMSSKKYNILSAKKEQLDGTNVACLVMGLNEDKIKIVTVKTDQGYKVYASIIEEENGIEKLKGYKFENNRIENTLTVDYDEKFKEALKQMHNLEVKEPIFDQIKSDLPCYYGHWCGPGCGSGEPIDGIDRCCKTHDNCYAQFGYFDCFCDDNLHKCLWPYVYYGVWSAIMVSAAFAAIPCINHHI